MLAVANGWTNTKIAERLILAKSTMKTHLSRVLAEPGAGPVRPRA
ncbi:LuxR C-terminal-related transcriptional regulator [Streptomyces fulvoviolaceus]|nr:LuxR C-terminal-related transcriptional regulator [Streptomyces fulvoviolaceus]